MGGRGRAEVTRGPRGHTERAGAVERTEGVWGGAGSTEVTGGTRSTGAPDPRISPDQRGGGRGQQAEDEQQRDGGLHGGGSRDGAAHPGGRALLVGMTAQLGRVS